MILDKAPKILQDFSRWWKGIYKNFGFFIKKSKIIQDLGEKKPRKFSQFQKFYYYKDVIYHIVSLSQ